MGRRLIKWFYWERSGFWLLLIVWMSTCTPFDGGNEDSPAFDEPLFINMKTKWQENQPSFYQLNYEIEAQIQRKIRTIVKNGEVQSVLSQRIGIDKEWIPVKEGQLGFFLLTIDDFFLEIQILSTQEVAALEVSYDKDIGYPSVINIDYDAQTIDDEIGYRLHLEILSAFNKLNGG